MTPSKKPILNFVIDPEQLERIDDFRFRHRFATRAEAVKWLLDWSLYIFDRFDSKFDYLDDAAKWIVRALEEKEKGRD